MIKTIGPVMLDIEGHELTEEDKKLLRNPLTGGVILFSRNFSSAEQLKMLVASVKNLSQPELLVAVDHEGGRVQRFKEPFTRIPALNVLGKKYDSDPQTALGHARIFGWLTAIELLAFNIDFSFTPVLDIDYGVSEVIGDRAFHHSPEVITKIAASYIDGLHEAGMASTGKHFPGHGGVSADSHTDIPLDERELDELLQKDILPFAKLIPGHLDAIMPAHVIYTKVKKEPAGFSTYWLKDILRDKLGFKGVIFSDDLDMKGASSISDDYSERASVALAAGCDMVLVCNNRDAAKQVLSRLDYKITHESARHLLKMRAREYYDWDTLIQTDAWKQAVKTVAEYN